jgi:hypothetical protein
LSFLDEERKLIRLLLGFLGVEENMNPWCARKDYFLGVEGKSIPYTSKNRN